jgi:hypothetical protein
MENSVLSTGAAMRLIRFSITTALRFGVFW